MNTVGSSLMMLDSKRPLASAGEPGVTTCNPGMWANHEYKLFECCGPWPHPLPMIARIVRGIRLRPPEANRHGATGCPSRFERSSARDGAKGRSIRRVCNRSEEHTSELQSLAYLVCRLLL